MDKSRPIIMITGATSGIGQATAELLAKEKAIIIATFYKEIGKVKILELNARNIGASDFLAVELDLTSRKSISEAVKTVTDHFDSIDVLINNAGYSIDKPLVEQSYNEIQTQIATNVTGTILLTQQILPQINSMIINLGSSAAKRGRMGHSVYSATKFALRGFTQALSQENRYLKIYCVNPDKTATAMTNFIGRPPIEVAVKIRDLIYSKNTLLSGSELNLWEETEA